MPNLSSVLKSEITRLSKKAVRQAVDPLRSAAGTQRKQLADLKRQVQQLQRELAAVRKAASGRPVAPEAESAVRRFTAKGLKSLRSRLGLSAEDFGLLLQVSGQTIYKWEQGKSIPRKAQVPEIAALRSIGKREAKNRLDAIKPG